MTMHLAETTEAKTGWYNAVFDLLVSTGGTHESMRDDFLYRHARLGEPCDEYRFQGKLGFGGKYLRKTNRVSLYVEDETPERVALRDRLNTELASLLDTYERAELARLKAKYERPRNNHPYANVGSQD